MMKKRVVALTTAAVMIKQLPEIRKADCPVRSQSGAGTWHWRILRNGQRSSRKRIRM